MTKQEAIHNIVAYAYAEAETLPQKVAESFDVVATAIRQKEKEEMSGVVRRVDEMGRIVLPKEIRNVLGISEGTPMDIYMSNGRVILKRYCAEDALSSLVGIFAESLEERSEDLEKGKAEDIKQHVREIQKLLKKN